MDDKNDSFFERLIDDESEEYLTKNLNYEKVPVQDNDFNNFVLTQLANEFREKIANLKVKERKKIVKKWFSDLFNKEITFDYLKPKKSLTRLSLNEIATSHLSAYLESEFANGEEVFIISPFISREGINLLIGWVKSFEGESLKINILTSTFDKTSKFLDLNAIEEFYKNFNSQKIKINIKIEIIDDDNQASRIHSKTYIFKRNNNFGSAYIGSANLTFAGMQTGTEWTTKIAEFKDPELFNESVNNFLLLWESEKNIDITNDEKFQILKLQKIHFQNAEKKFNEIVKKRMTFVDNVFDQECHNLKEITNRAEPYFKPKKYQINILNRLRNRRINNFKKHLIIMATGTGKTVVAAINYKNMCDEQNQEFLSMIFVARQKEILIQARSTFAKELNINEEKFGVMLFDGNQIDIDNSNIIFATDTSLKSKLDQFIDKKFDVAIFDEAHHIAAPVFSKIFNVIAHNANQVIGLTATPEREDGYNVDQFFDDEAAIDLRLWDAISEGMLSNFIYFYLNDDSVDLAKIKLDDTEKLSVALNVGSRHNFILKTINEYIGSTVDTVSVVLFCTTVKHAEDTSAFLQQNNINAEVLTGTTNSIERKRIIEDFKLKKINFICVVNIFNEGIDVPNIDHIFLLRPTKSLTLFIQQIGRGLRLKKDKCLQIFDFINNIDVDFNKTFNPLQNLSGLTKNIFNLIKTPDDLKLLQQNLPLGSNLVFEPKSKNRILNIIKKTIWSRSNFNKYIEDQVKKLDESSYENFEKIIQESNTSIQNVYKWRDYKSLLEVNNDKAHEKTLRNVVFFNHGTVIKEFIKIIESKSLSSNKLINDLFYVTILEKFYYERYPDKKNKSLKELGFQDKDSYIFSKKFEIRLLEILYILKFKLKYDQNLIFTKEINKESFVNVLLRPLQVYVVIGIINTNHYDPYFPRETFWHKDDEWKNKAIIFAKESLMAENVDYINRYNEDKNEFEWASPNRWTAKHKNKIDFDKKYESFIMYLTLEAEQNTNGVYLFLGKVKKIKSCTPNEWPNKGFGYTLEV